MDKLVKLKRSAAQTNQNRSTSTPVSNSKKDVPSVHLLDTSTISNISLSEKEADVTPTNVTAIEVCSKVSNIPRASKPERNMGKENVKTQGKAKSRELKASKKRKRDQFSDDEDSDEDTIVFVENPNKSIQLNQSTTEEFLRLGTTEKEVAVGIFWDIENVRMPKGINPAILISKLREKFVDESSKFCEKHFYVVCDAREESHLIMKQLFEFHVRIIHVPRLKANSSDNVIRDLMHEFVGYNKYCRLILISGDCDFSHDIHNFRRNKKCDCILVHNKLAKESLIHSATSAYLYTDLIKDELDKHQAQRKTVIYQRKIKKPCYNQRPKYAPQSQMAPNHQYAQYSNQYPTQPQNNPFQQFNNRYRW